MALFNLGRVKDLLKVGKKFNNKDFLKATVGMAVATAFADGSCDDAEIVTMEALIKNDESLSAFNENEVQKEIDAAKTQFNVSVVIGKLVVEKSVKALAGEDQKEMAFAIALAVAGADGNIDDKEKSTLKSFASILGISTAKFGI